jgi:hypothetical protein
LTILCASLIFAFRAASCDAFVNEDAPEQFLSPLLLLRLALRTEGRGGEELSARARHVAPSKTDFLNRPLVLPTREGQVAGSFYFTFNFARRWSFHHVAETADISRHHSRNNDAAEALLPSPPEGRRELVKLDPDHPGFRDLAYRARRDEIAEIALCYEPGSPVPDAPYTGEEHQLWRIVREALGPQHQSHACAEYLECVRRLDLPRERIPQLREISEKVRALSGFRLEPVGGLVTPRVFWSRWRTACSCQLNTSAITRRHSTRPSRTWCTNYSARRHARQRAYGRTQPARRRSGQAHDLR